MEEAAKKIVNKEFLKSNKRARRWCKDEELLIKPEELDKTMKKLEKRIKNENNKEL